MKLLKRFIIAAAVIVFAAAALSILFPESLFSFSQKMERSSAGLVKKEISIGEDKFVYLEGGAGKDTMVFIHGFGGDKDNWARMAKYMKEYHCIIPDLPGFGESTKLLSSKYDVASQVVRLDKFFSRLGVNNFYLAGNSMGGNISGIYAAKYSGKVKGLILVNNAGVKVPVKSPVFKLIEQGKNPLLVNTGEDFNRLLKFIFVKEPFIPYPVKRVLVDRAVRSREFNEKVFKEFTGMPVMLENNFSAINMPVLIIWGDKDQILDVSSVSVLEKGLKNYTTRILKECGHVPMMERPEETAMYIKDFTKLLK